MAGILSFIPYVGSITGMLDRRAARRWRSSAPGAACSWWSASSSPARWWRATSSIPRLLGDRVELHAVWVIFALFAGGVAFGFLGVLLAVPMAAAIGVVARYWLRRYLESPLYLDPPRGPGR